MNKTNLRIGIVILVLIGAYLGFDREQKQNPQLNNTQSAVVQSETQSTIDDSEKIRQAFRLLPKEPGMPAGVDRGRARA